VAVAAILVVRHRSNIGRMIRRDERRMEGPAESAA
jgi:glycerol-3-phosphate acyltransferase PlsY